MGARLALQAETYWRMVCSDRRSGPTERRYRSSKIIARKRAFAHLGKAFPKAEIVGIEEPELGMLKSIITDFQRKPNFWPAPEPNPLRPEVRVDPMVKPNWSTAAQIDRGCVQFTVLRDRSALLFD